MLWTGGRVGQKGGGGEGGGGEGGGEEEGDYLTLSHCRLYEICQESCWWRNAQHEILDRRSQKFSNMLWAELLKEMMKVKYLVSGWNLWGKKVAHNIIWTLINVYNVDKRLAVSFVVCLSSTRLPRQCQQRLLGIPNMGYYAGNSGYLFLFIYLSCSLILPSSKITK